MSAEGKTIKRAVLWEGSVGTFAIEEAELPGGPRVELALLHHPGAAAVVPCFDRDRILLLWQYRHAVGRYLWEVPAGKLDRDEDPEHCALRELEEETGYRAKRIERTGEIVTTPGFSDERIHLFLAWELEPGVLAREPSERIELRELRLSQALEMVRAGAIVDAKSIIALQLAAERVAHGLP